ARARHADDEDRVGCRAPRALAGGEEGSGEHLASGGDFGSRAVGFESLRAQGVAGRKLPERRSEVALLFVRYAEGEMQVWPPGIGLRDLREGGFQLGAVAVVERPLCQGREPPPRLALERCAADGA